jgi:hypothetical protein
MYIATFNENDRGSVMAQCMGTRASSGSISIDWSVGRGRALQYQRVQWIHDMPDEPVVLYSEVDENGREVRKVEEFRDGRLDLADDLTQTGSTELSEGPLPSLEAINANPTFSGEPISEGQFHFVWSRAWERLLSGRRN